LIVSMASEKDEFCLRRSVLYQANYVS